MVNKYRISGPPEDLALEDIRKVKVEMARLARDMSTDKALVQASHSLN